MPRSKEVFKTVCCLWCASGPIIMTVNLPRTGYCVDRDSIPLEVTIDNGSNRSVKSLTAAIERTVVYKASPGGSRPTGPFPVASTSSEPIAPHSTFVWKPDNFEVPDVEPTSIFDTAINIVYHLKVSAAIKYGRDPKISIYPCRWAMYQHLVLMSHSIPSMILALSISYVTLLPCHLLTHPLSVHAPLSSHAPAPLLALVDHITYSSQYILPNRRQILLGTILVKYAAILFHYLINNKLLSDYHDNPQRFYSTISILKN